MSELSKLLNEPEGEILLSIIAAISIFFMILCIWSVMTVVKKRKKCHQEVDLKICDFYEDRFSFTNFKKSEKSMSAAQYRPIFEYYYNDKRYTYQSKFVTYPDKTDIGEMRTLYINPDNPTQVREKEDFNIWSSVVACVAANITLVLFFILSMI